MLSVKKTNDLTIVSFIDIDKIELPYTSTLKPQLQEFFNEPNTKLIIDLEDIKAIDSSGFGIFFSIMRSAKENSGQFKFANVSKQIFEYFEYFHLENVFDLFSTLDECVESYH